MRYPFILIFALFCFVAGEMNHALAHGHASTVSVRASSAITAGSTARFTITRTGHLSTAITVNFGVFQNHEGLIRSNPSSVTFSPGQSSRTVSIATNPLTYDLDATIELSLFGDNSYDTNVDASIAYVTVRPRQPAVRPSNPASVNPDTIYRQVLNFDSASSSIDQGDTLTLVVSRDRASEHPVDFRVNISTQSQFMETASQRRSSFQVSGTIAAWSREGFISIETREHGDRDGTLRATLVAYGSRYQVGTQRTHTVSLELVVSQDAMWVWSASDDVPGMRGAKAESHRYRTGLELGYRFDFSESSLRVHVAGDVEHHGGDIENDKDTGAATGLQYAQDPVAIGIESVLTSPHDPSLSLGYTLDDWLAQIIVSEDSVSGHLDYDKDRDGVGVVLDMRQSQMTVGYGFFLWHRETLYPYLAWRQERQEVGLEYRFHGWSAALSANTDRVYLFALARRW